MKVLWQTVISCLLKCWNQRIWRYNASSSNNESLIYFYILSPMTHASILKAIFLHLFLHLLNWYIEAAIFFFFCKGIRWRLHISIFSIFTSPMVRSYQTDKHNASLTCTLRKWYGASDRTLLNPSPLSHPWGLKQLLPIEMDLGMR